MPAADGPDDWQRIEARPEGQPTDDRNLARVEPAETIEHVDAAAGRGSDVRQTDDSISFSVDQIGVPVLVKVSYFPNWKVDGAQGPYRVAPNLMVVVPTANHVTLHLRHQ